MTDGTARPGDDAGRCDPNDETSDLGSQLAGLDRRLAALESRTRLRAELVELVDANGAVRARLGYLGEEDVVGLECRRRDGSLSVFVGQVDGDGSLMCTGGRYDQFVLDLGASEDGAYLRVGDPDDPGGEQVRDVLGLLKPADEPPVG